MSVEGKVLAMPGAHGPKSATEQASGEGAEHECVTCGRTCTAAQSAAKKQPRINPTRRRYADLAAEDLATTFGADRGTWQSWAERLGISRQDARRFGETGGARVAVGDVLLAPAEKAIAYFKGLVKRLEGLGDDRLTLPASIDETLHRARCELADVDKALAPGRKHTVEQLRRAKREAHEAALAAALVEQHVDEQLAALESEAE